MEWLPGLKDPAPKDHKHRFRIEIAVFLGFDRPWMDFRCRTCGVRCTTDRTILYREMTRRV